MTTAKNSVAQPEATETPEPSPFFAHAIAITRAYAQRLQTHSCDETCRCCPICYQTLAVEVCARLCVHADGEL